jgi:hypothetical protein
VNEFNQNKSPKLVYINPKKFQRQLSPIGYKEFKSYQAQDLAANNLSAYVRKDIYDALVEMLAQRGIQDGLPNLTD